jgi:hypothetical protein
MTNNFLVAGTDAMAWTLIEPGVAIVASSLATIRPLLRAMKIRGFESTDNTYGTGHSAGLPSSTNRAKPAVLAMPGFGPEDVSLSNITHQNKTNGRSHPDDVHILPPRNFTEGPLSPGQVSIVKSEILVIQGNSSPPSSWRSQTNGSPSSSFEQLHDLEAQSQDIERSRNNMSGR